MLPIGFKCCPYCRRSSHIHISRFKTLWEVAALVLLLRPVRCHDCLLRFYQPAFIKISPRSASRSATAREEEEKEFLEANEPSDRLA